MNKQPTTTQLFALIKFANSRGRTWKSQLNQAWMTGSYGFADDSMNLQQVRNEFGPSWLARFKLPKVDIVATGNHDKPLRAVIATS